MSYCTCLTVITCLTFYWPRRRSFLWGFFKIRKVKCLTCLISLARLTCIACLTCYWPKAMLFPSAIDNVKYLTCLTCLTSLTRLTRLTSLTLLPLIVCLTCYWLWTTFLLATILQNPWRYYWENTFLPATIHRRSQKLSFQRNIDFSRQFCLHRRPNPASP